MICCNVRMYSPASSGPILSCHLTHGRLTTFCDLFYDPHEQSLAHTYTPLAPRDGRLAWSQRQAVLLCCAHAPTTHMCLYAQTHLHRLEQGPCGGFLGVVMGSKHEQGP